jgi:putative heme-binding domain-containing protein
LYERQDKSAVSRLENLLARTPFPRTRVHALWSLLGLDSLSEHAILAALSDSHAGVRENAVRLAERRLDASQVLRDKVAVLVGDPELRVRLQVALAIGETRQWDQPALLARLLRENVGEPWIQSAALSSAGDCTADLFAALAPDAGMGATDQGVGLLQQLATVIGTQNRPADVKRAIDVLPESGDISMVLRVATSLGEGLERAGASLRAADLGGRVLAILGRAPELAGDVSQPESLRRAALGALALVTYAQAAPPLLGMLRPSQPPELQEAAIDVLMRFREPQVTGALLERFSSLSRGARKRALDVVIGRSERLPALWAAIENRTVHPGELSASHVNTLRRHRDSAVRQRASELLGNANTSGRQEVYAAFLPALQLAGDVARGQAQFEKLCSACHRFSGFGHDFGPNLQAARSGGKEKLLMSILDPNREVLPLFFVCTVETSDGESVVGFLESESATSVTLRQPGGLKRTLSRDRIQSLKTQPQSLMPEGLETGLSARDMADLIAFLCKPVG